MAYLVEGRHSTAESALVVARLRASVASGDVSSDRVLAAAQSLSQITRGWRGPAVSGKIRAMLRLFGIVVSIGLADSMNPSTIAPGLYLAVGERARSSLIQFTLAVFAVNLVGGAVIALGPGQVDPRTSFRIPTPPRDTSSRRSQAR